MKPMWVNRTARVTEGALKEKEGLVVAFDSELDEVKLKMDELSTVTISSDYLAQQDYNPDRCEECEKEVDGIETGEPRWCSECQ